MKRLPTLFYLDTNEFIKLNNYLDKRESDMDDGIEDFLFRIISNELITYFSVAHVEDLSAGEYQETVSVRDIIQILTKGCCIVRDQSDGEYVKVYSNENIYIVTGEYGGVFKEVLDMLERTESFKIDFMKHEKISKEMSDFAKNSLIVEEDGDIPDNTFEYMQLLSRNLLRWMNSKSEYSMYKDRMEKWSKLYEKDVNKCRSMLDDGDLDFLTKEIGILQYFAEDDLVAKMTGLFFFLDTIRFASDSICSTMFVDASHAAYAALGQSEYFITEDKRLRRKAEIGYKLLGCIIKPVSLAEFISEMNERFANQPNV